jgi:hypothetical protein
MKRLLLILLLAGSLSAQTIQNPSFELSPPTSPNWNYGPVPNWQCTGGQLGLFSPTASQVHSGVTGLTTLWLNAGTACTQDAGPVAANTSYLLTVSVGSQIGFNGSYTLSYAGCSVSGTTGQGILVPVTLACPNATGELLISLSTTSGQVLFDNLSLTIPGPPPPFVFQLQGGPAVTFMMFVPPACSSADGTPCSIQIQVIIPPAAVCTTDAVGTMTCTAPTGQINLVKSTASQTQTVPVAVAQ